MVQTGFWIGNRDWWIMASVGIDGGEDLGRACESLLAAGLPADKAREVCRILSYPDTGYTYTDYDGRYTLAFVSRGSSIEQMYDTMLHELKHIVEHISTYFGVDPKSEEAAYLQGELGRLLFPTFAIAVCPSYFTDAGEKY